MPARLSATLYLPRDLENVSLAAARVIFQRLTTPRREYGNGPQQFSQRIGAAGVEAAVSAARELGDLLERICGALVISFMKHEHRHTMNAKLAGQRSKAIDIFLHAVADKYQRIYPAPLRFVGRMAEHLADLRLSRPASHRGHQSDQISRVGQPATDLELPETTIETELQFQSAKRLGRLKHLALDPCRMVPSRLTACSRVHSENQPANLIRRPHVRRRGKLGEKRFNFLR